MKSTIDYYNENAQFWLDHISQDIPRRERLYTRFLKHVPRGGHILDAGCGTGHDIKTFLDQGFKVTAFDASEELVRIAKKISGNPVLLETFETIDLPHDRFDAIWANASLLHVAQKDTFKVFKKLWYSLKLNGVWHIRVRYGRKPMWYEGRYFSGFTKKEFTALFDKLGPHHFDIYEIRAPRSVGWRWIEAVVIKK